VITTAQFKNGMAIQLNGELYTIMEFQHVKPGKGGAFVRTKLKNIRLGTIIDKTFRAGEKIEEAFIEQRKWQYLYRKGNEYFFLDLENFEEVEVSPELLGKGINFLKEETEVVASLHKQKVIALTLPIFVELKVTHTEPGLRGDTVKSGTKAAELETGAIIQIPLFINTGDTIKIDTRTGEYVGRI
jgi:elongation factor P